MSPLDADQRFMHEALEVAEQGRYSASPNPAVGCVLVNNGQRIATGFHAQAGQGHAEINALTAAGTAARGATAYVTLEPCNHHGRTGPCTEALIDAGIRRVVYAVADPNPSVSGRGAQKLAAAGIEITSGICATEAEVFHCGYLSRMRRQRPYIRVKVAMSLDGAIALANGESRWITGDVARAEVQRLRAQACAVVTGVGTVLADDPSLNVRTDSLAMRGRQPRRIVLDSSLRTPPTANMLDLAGETRLVTTLDDPIKRQALTDAGAVVDNLGGGERVSLKSLLPALNRLELNEILVEAGPTLVGEFLRHRYFDQLIVHLAPKLLGRQARQAFELASPAKLADALELELVHSTLLGSDIAMTFEPRA